MPLFRNNPKTFFRLLFLGCLFLLIVPIWRFPYFPSADGPSHLFNSYVFLHYSTTPIFRNAFTLQIPPAGNLTGHGLAIELMRLSITPPNTEKAIATLCILGLAFAFWYAFDAVKPAYPAGLFLVLPFLYNWPTQMGFWSFSFGVPFVLLCLGLCLRYCGRWNVVRVLLLFVCVTAVYACHPLSWAVCGLTVSLMAFASEFRSLRNGPDRARAWSQFLLPVLTFLPFVIPNFIFASENKQITFDRIKSLSSWLWPIYTVYPVRLFAADMRPARALFLVLLLALLANLIWRRQRRVTFPDVLLPVSVVLFLLGLLSPGRIGEGTFIEVRLLLFGFLVLILWLAVTLPKPLSQIVAVLSVLLAAWLIIGRFPAWGKANIELSAIARLGQDIAPNTFVCQIDERQQSENVEPLDHAVDLWAPRNIVDVLDYEAGRKAFWTRFKTGYYLDEDFLRPASHANFEAALDRFEKRTGKKLDYLLITSSNSSPGTLLRRLLPTEWNEYKLVGTGPYNIALFQRVS